MKGSCFCGDVSYEVQSSPLWCGHCHCSMCQRVHGAAFVTWVGCAANDVAIDQQDQALHWFESSKGAARGSCRRCGTNLFFRSDNWPGELHVTRASVTGACELEPQGHAFFETHASWFPFSDELPRKA